MKKILSILMAALFSVGLFAGTKELKVIPGVWSTANAVIAGWAWEGEGEGAWFTFTGEGDTLSAQVAENANNIIFVRMNPAVDFGWDAEWNRYQTTINWDKAFKVAGWDNYEWVDFAGSGAVDPDPTPEPIADPITIYFVNNLGWENVNAYVWGDSEYKPWPGEAAAKEAEQIHELDVYAYTFPKNNVNIIFNNGTAQTVNLTLDEAHLYFVPGEADLAGKFQGTWYAKAEIPEPSNPEPPVVNNRVIYLNTGGAELWGIAEAAYYIHAWGGNGVDVKMAAVSAGVFKAEIPENNANLVFVRMNPEATAIGYTEEEGMWNKTVDLEIPADKDLFTITSWDNGVWSVYSSEPVDPEPPVVNNRVIYLNDGGAELWGAAEAAYYIHAWGGNEADVKMAAVSAGVFKAEIPENNTKLVFVRMDPAATAIAWTEEEGMWNKTVDLEIPADKDLFTITSWDNGVWSVYSSDPVDPEPPVVNRKEIALVPNIWNVDEVTERYAAWAWSTEADGEMVELTGTDTVRGMIKESALKVIFLRMNPEGALDWPAEWNRTVDIDINWESGVYTITGWGEGDPARSIGTWEKVTPVDPIDPEPPVVNNRVIYLNDGGAELWGIAEAVYYIHAWGGNEVDVKMAAVSEGVFKAEIPENNTNLVFVRMNPSATAIGWTEEEGMWNKTVDLEIPADKDLFTITAWDNGEWSVYSGTPSGIENTTSGAKATKVIRNGQIMIIKGENTYNMMGIRVK